MRVIVRAAALKAPDSTKFLINKRKEKKMVQVVVFLINAAHPIKGDPVQIEVSGEELVNVLLERVSKTLGRPLVDMGMFLNSSQAIQALRLPRVYLNGTLMELSNSFQTYGISDQNVSGGGGSGSAVVAVVCDCRPRFPVLTPCHFDCVGTDQSGKDVVQLTTVAGAQAPYKYQFVRTLSNAIYGKVKLVAKLHLQPDGAYRPSTPVEYYACKIMFKERMSLYNPTSTLLHSEDPLMELATQQFLGTCMGQQAHPNLMGLVECCEDRLHIFALMHFLDGGELYDFIARSRATTYHGKPVDCIPESAARGIYQQVVQGVARMHECLVVHSDLSAENVMIGLGPTVLAQVIDFGEFFFLFFFFI